MVGAQSARAGFSRHSDRHGVGVCRTPTDSGKGDGWNESRIGQLNSEQTLSGKRRSPPALVRRRLRRDSWSIPHDDTGVACFTRSLRCVCVSAPARSPAQKTDEQQFSHVEERRVPHGRSVCRSHSILWICKLLKGQTIVQAKSDGPPNGYLSRT